MYKYIKELVLFVLLTLVVIINPRWSTNLYSTILGRLLLVVILAYFAMCNTTLALMATLLIIIGFNYYYTSVMYGIEGFSNTIKEEKKKEDVGMELANNDGPLDYTHLEQNIRPKESGSIEPQLNNSSEEVEPTSMENFESQPSDHSYE